MAAPASASVAASASTPTRAAPTRPGSSGAPSAGSTSKKLLTEWTSWAKFVASRSDSRRGVDGTASWVSCRRLRVRSEQSAAGCGARRRSLFDDPTVAAEAGAVRGLACSRSPASRGLVCQSSRRYVLWSYPRSATDAVGAPSGPTDPATYRWHPVEQREQLGDVVAVAAGERPGERQSAAVYEEMLLAAPTAPIDRAGTRVRAPFFACTWLESAIARDHSISPAACNSASNTLAAARCQTPACVVRRRAAVANMSSPQPKPSSLREMLPTDPGMQHEQDPLQRQPIIERLATRIAETPLPLGQERLDPLPQPIRHIPRLRPHRPPPDSTSFRKRMPTDSPPPNGSLHSVRASKSPWTPTAASLQPRTPESRSASTAANGEGAVELAVADAVEAAAEAGFHSSLNDMRRP